MSLDMEIAEGIRASQILSDPLVQEAFAVLEAKCVQQWRDAPARDTEGKEAIWMMLKTAQKFKAHFEALVQTGNMATQQVEFEKKQSLLKKVFS